MRAAYFDCFSGAAGDMILAACIECGFPVDTLRKGLAKLKLPPRSYALKVSRVKRCGLAATHLDVRVRPSAGTRTQYGWARKSQSAQRVGRPSAGTPARSHADIRRLIDRSRLSRPVRERAQRIFRRLAIAEAERHGVRTDRVRFHEVDAIDAIVDIVGASLAVEVLKLDRIWVGNIHVGTGEIQTEHGRYPVPSPAVLTLLKGKRLSFGGPKGEIITSTGAAILAEIARERHDAPSFEIERVGYGAGTVDRPGRPNVLRLILGEVAPQMQEDRVTVIKTNIDDMIALNYELLFKSLFKEGALDVTLTPIQMKKQRPAVQISVIAPPGRRDAIARYLLKETTSLGVRYSDWGRLKLRRRMTTVKTAQGLVKVKVGFLNGRVLRASPEYEDCKRLADRKKVSFMRVYENAKEAARALVSSEGT